MRNFGTTAEAMISELKILSKKLRARGLHSAAEVMDDAMILGHDALKNDYDRLYLPDIIDIHSIVHKQFDNID